MESNARLTNRLNGEIFPYIVKWSYESNYFTAADGFELGLLGVDPAYMLGLPVKLEIRVDDVWRKVLDGRIDVVESGEASGVVTVKGRDYIGDLTETHLDPAFALRDGETPDAIILRAMKDYGIKDVVGPEGAWFSRNVKTTGTMVRRKRARKATFNASDPLFAELKPQKGMGLWEFAERFATRFGYTLQPTDDPSVLSLSRPDYEQAPLYELRRKSNSDPCNNVVTSSAERDITALPTQLQFGAKSGALKKTVAGIGKALDVVEATKTINKSLALDLEGKIASEPTRDGLKLYRYRYQEDKEAKTEEQLNFLTQRRLGQFLKEALTYKATVDEHCFWQNKNMWTIDTVVTVDDDIAGVHEPMWIEAVHMSWDTKNGTRAEISCWRLGAAIVGDPPPVPYVPAATAPSTPEEHQSSYLHYNPLTEMSEIQARDYKWNRGQASGLVNRQMATEDAAKNPYGRTPTNWNQSDNTGSSLYE